MSALMGNYNPLPVTFSHGEGVWLYDTQGKQYLDALSGIAVCTLGHAHPAITAALQDQATKLLHTSNAFHIAEQERLAERLTQLAGMESAFFCNSGAEANEAALKLARLYGHQKEIEKPQVIVMERAFHGRTLATLSASGSRKVQAGFEPLVSGFIRAPFNDIDALKTIATNSPHVVAILLEPIQGEGGIHPMHDNYLNQVRELCDTQDWLLMLDEVQTGIGRSGKFFAYQYTAVLPDIVTSAKGLGAGVPIGACLARGKAAHLFKPGNHGSTFGGNPLVCRVANTVLDIVSQDNLAEHAARMGEKLKTGLQQRFADHPAVRDIRGQGLMVGMELDRPCRDLLKLALDAGLVMNVTADTVVRFLPPLIIQADEIDTLLDRLELCCQQFLAASA